MVLRLLVGTLADRLGVRHDQRAHRLDEPGDGPVRRPAVVHVTVGLPGADHLQPVAVEVGRLLEGEVPRRADGCGRPRHEHADEVRLGHEARGWQFDEVEPGRRPLELRVVQPRARQPLLRRHLALPDLVPHVDEERVARGVQRVEEPFRVAGHQPWEDAVGEEVVVSPRERGRLTSDLLCHVLAPYCPPTPAPGTRYVRGVAAPGDRQGAHMGVDTESIVAWIAEVVGDDRVEAGDAIKDDYGHDEALTATPVRPASVAYPRTTDEVARLLRQANERGVPVTARGAGTGLSGGCRPRE